MVLYRQTRNEVELFTISIRYNGKDKANHTHFEVAKKVRKTLQELCGAMPENLPVAGSIKKSSNRTETPKLKKQ